jgi:CheY-like chemotaxis protein
MDLLRKRGALLGLHHPQAAARAHASGYQEHLAKPINPDALAEAILALRQRHDG